MNAPSFEIRSLFFREQNASYATSPHLQHVWQWYCVVYGDVLMTVDGTPHRLDAGTSILIRPERIRSPRCHKTAPGYVICEFTVDPAFRPDLGVLTLGPSAVPARLKESLLSLVDELRGSDEGDDGLLAWVLFSRILLGQWRGAKGKAAPLSLRPEGKLHPLRNEELAARMESVLQRRFRENLRRTEISEVIGLSPSQCARIFLAATGKTLANRLVELRMAEAKSLLVNSTLSIGDVAMEVGFDSFSHFSQAFRRHAGVSPKAWREAGGRVWRRA